MSLIPWSDRTALSSLRSNFGSLIDELFRNDAELTHMPAALRRGLVPPLNVAETDKELIATVELPGLEEQDIEVQVMGNTLIVSGERKWEQEKKGKEFHRVESQYGSFRRSVSLPEGLVTDGDAIQATFNKGVLEVRIPKSEQKPTTKVKVKAK